MKEKCDNLLNYGLNKKIVCDISARKHEPVWLRDMRLQGYEQFKSLPLPHYGPDLSSLDIETICFYNAPYSKPFDSWENVPSDIKQTFAALGIPDHEQRWLAGLGTQYESEMLFKQLQDRWKEQGVIFCSMDEAVASYPEIVRQYLGTLVPSHDNKFAALNTAVWSGGSFVFVPEGVSVELPMHAYFRMQAERMGQFERTLIIAQPGSNVHYIEGCSAPLYNSYSLHCAVVEIIAHQHSRVRYTTIQNWSHNVYNLVTKRAIAHEDAVVEWVDGNFGSMVTMKYPCIVLAGARSKGLLFSLSRSQKGQIIDSGAKFIHQAPDTRSQCIAKSVIHGAGKSVYRGLVVMTPQAINALSYTQCDALVLSPEGTVDAFPLQKVATSEAVVSHEASVSALDGEQVLYCMSRGITSQTARTLLVHGFADVFVQELPLEYAVELGRLLSLDLQEPR